MFQVTNDIFTKEDGEFLVKHGALPEERIRAVETGGCPHAAIREDISINLGPLEELSNLYKADILLCESGGGNLENDIFFALCMSREHKICLVSATLEPMCYVITKISDALLPGSGKI